MNSDDLHTLPPYWTYEIQNDGRVLYVDEQTGQTSWIHPITQRSMQLAPSAGRQDTYSSSEQNTDNRHERPGPGMYYDDPRVRVEPNQPTQHDYSGHVPYEDILIPPQQVQGQRPPIEQSVHHADDDDDVAGTNDAAENNANIKRSNSKKSSSVRRSFKDKWKKLTKQNAAQQSADHGQGQGQDDGHESGSGIVLQGWLHKQSTGALKSWKKYWCVLSGFSMRLSKEAGERPVLNIILAGYRASRCSKENDAISRKFSFKMVHPNAKKHFFSAETIADSENWIENINAAISHHQAERANMVSGARQANESNSQSQQSSDIMNRSFRGAENSFQQQPGSAFHRPPSMSRDLNTIQSQNPAMATPPIPPRLDHNKLESDNNTYAQPYVRPLTENNVLQQQQHTPSSSFSGPVGGPSGALRSPYGDYSAAQRVPSSAELQARDNNAMRASQSQLQVPYQSLPATGHLGPGARGYSPSPNTRGPSTSYGEAYSRASVSRPSPLEPPYQRTQQDSFNQSHAPDVSIGGYGGRPQEPIGYQHNAPATPRDSYGGFGDPSARQPDVNDGVIMRRQVNSQNPNDSRFSPNEAYNPNFAPRSPSYDNSRTPGHVSYRPDDTVELSTATMSKLSKLHRESMRATGDWLPPDATGNSMSAERPDARGTSPHSHSQRGIDPDQRYRGNANIAPSPYTQARHDVYPITEHAAVDGVPSNAQQERMAFDRLRERLTQQRVRLSISAGDLVGKSQEEVVLLLIQVRRLLAQLNAMKDFYNESLLKTDRQKNDLETDEIAQSIDEVDKELDIARPIMNLLTNIVTMSSVYGGSNLMMATQYKKQLLQPDELTAPRKLLEFSRLYQENKLRESLGGKLQQLTADEADLEEKLQRLYELDRKRQTVQFQVASLQEDLDLLEKALEGVDRQQQLETDLREVQKLAQRRMMVDNELTQVRQQLSTASKALEDVTTDNTRVENEVALLRAKMSGLSKSPTSTLPRQEAVRNQQYLEKELSHVQAVVTDLSTTGAKLSETVLQLRRSCPNLNTASQIPVSDDERPYLETDLDTGRTTNIALASRRDPALRSKIHKYERESIMPPEGDRRPRKAGLYFEWAELNDGQSPARFWRSNTLPYRRSRSMSTLDRARGQRPYASERPQSAPRFNNYTDGDRRGFGDDVFRSAPLARSDSAPKLSTTGTAADDGRRGFNSNTNPPRDHVVRRPSAVADDTFSKQPAGANNDLARIRSSPNVFDQGNRNDPRASLVSYDRRSPRSPDDDFMNVPVKPQQQQSAPHQPYQSQQQPIRSEGGYVTANYQQRDYNQDDDYRPGDDYNDGYKPNDDYDRGYVTNRPVDGQRNDSYRSQGQGYEGRLPRSAESPRPMDGSGYDRGQGQQRQLSPGDYRGPQQQQNQGNAIYSAPRSSQPLQQYPDQASNVPRSYYPGPEPLNVNTTHGGDGGNNSYGRALAAASPLPSPGGREVYSYQQKPSINTPDYNPRHQPSGQAQSYPRNSITPDFSRQQQPYQQQQQQQPPLLHNQQQGQGYPRGSMTPEYNRPQQQPYLQQPYPQPTQYIPQQQQGAMLQQPQRIAYQPPYASVQGQGQVRSSPSPAGGSVYSPAVAERQAAAAASGPGGGQGASLTPSVRDLKYREPGKRDRNSVQSIDSLEGHGGRGLTPTQGQAYYGQPGAARSNSERPSPSPLPPATRYDNFGNTSPEPQVQMRRSLSNSQPVRSSRDPTSSTAGSRPNSLYRLSSENAGRPVKATQHNKDIVPHPDDLLKQLDIPDKVTIPDRYVSDSDSDGELGEDSTLKRRRSERIKRLVLESSLQNYDSLKERPVTPADEARAQRQREQELRQRQKILDVTHQLADDASRRSREMAASNMSSRMSVASRHSFVQ